MFLCLKSLQANESATHTGLPELYFYQLVPPTWPTEYFYSAGFSLNACLDKFSHSFEFVDESICAMKVNASLYCGLTGRLGQLEQLHPPSVQQ